MSEPLKAEFYVLKNDVFMLYKDTMDWHQPIHKGDYLTLGDGDRELLATDDVVEVLATIVTHHNTKFTRVYVKRIGKNIDLMKNLGAVG